MKYIAKPDTWFKSGTEVELVDDYSNASTTDFDFNMGLFRGIRVCENPDSEGKWKSVGEEYLDEEVCNFDEFDEVVNE